MAPVDWDERWRTGNTPWDEGASPPALEQLVQRGRVPSGRVFVPGCGAGYDLATLAHPSRHVVGLDLSHGARDAFFAVHRDLPGKVSYEVGDFFTFDPPALFGFVWDYTFFCALDPPERQPWAALMSRIVQAEGLLATLLFPYADPIPDREGPPWPVNTAMVQEHLGKSFTLVESSPVDAAHPGRAHQERLALWKRANT